MRILSACLVSLVLSCNSGAKVEYYPNGNIQSKTLKIDSNTNFQEYYYWNGVKQYQAYFEDGLRQGIGKDWYENGELRYHGGWNLGIPLINVSTKIGSAKIETDSTTPYFPVKSWRNCRVKISGVHPEYMTYIEGTRECDVEMLVHDSLHDIRVRPKIAGLHTIIVGWKINYGHGMGEIIKREITFVAK